MATQHAIYPQSQKASYTENDSVDFVLSYDGEKLVPNSVRLTGQFRATKLDGTPITGDVKYDGMVGIHSVFDSFNISTMQEGFLENCMSYQRVVKSQFQATQNKNQAVSESDKTCELRCGNDEMTSEILKGMSEGGGNRALPFSMAPNICLNRTLAGALRYAKQGAVMVNCRLAPTIDIFYGADSGDCQYEIIDLKLTYQSLPDDGKNDPVVMEVKTVVRNNIVSSAHQVSTKVPIVALAFSATFIKPAHQSVTAYNNLACEVLDINRMEIELNDNNSYLAFPIDSREEILYNYILANANSKFNDMSLEKLKAGIGYGIGMPFGGSYNFSERKFGLNIQSSASNADPYNMYMVFSGIIKV